MKICLNFCIQNIFFSVDFGFEYDLDMFLIWFCEIQPKQLCVFALAKNHISMIIHTQILQFCFVNQINKFMKKIQIKRMIHS